LTVGLHKDGSVLRDHNLLMSAKGQLERAGIGSSVVAYEFIGKFAGLCKKTGFRADELLHIFSDYFRFSQTSHGRSFRDLEHAIRANKLELELLEDTEERLLKEEEQMRNGSAEEAEAS